MQKKTAPVYILLLYIIRDYFVINFLINQNASTAAAGQSGAKCNFFLPLSSLIYDKASCFIFNPDIN